MKLARVGNQIFDPEAIVTAIVEGVDGDGKPRTITLHMINGDALRFTADEAALVWAKVGEKTEDWGNPGAGRFGFF
jgi:hypothetical protein